MSDSVRPHRRQPTRLPHPWDSPGKNTGVGCHFLLQCMKVTSESEVAQSCPTLRNPMDRSLPGSSIHRIFQARVLECGAIAFSEINRVRSHHFKIFLSGLCLKSNVFGHLYWGLFMHGGRNSVLFLLVVLSPVLFWLQIAESVGIPSAMRSLPHLADPTSLLDPCLVSGSFSHHGKWSKG